jgi:hypothetical protein
LWITARSIRIHGFTPSSTWFIVLFPTALLTGLAGLRAGLPDLPLSAWIALSWSIGAAGLVLMVAIIAWQGVDIMRLVRSRAPVRTLRPDPQPAK